MHRGTTRPEGEEVEVVGDAIGFDRVAGIVSALTKMGCSAWRGQALDSTGVGGRHEVALCFHGEHWDKVGQTYSGAGADLGFGAKNVGQFAFTLVSPLGSEDNGCHGRSCELERALRINR